MNDDALQLLYPSMATIAGSVPVSTSDLTGIELMYGNPAPQEKQSPASPTPPLIAPASATDTAQPQPSPIELPIPEHILQLRQGDPLRVMFPAQAKADLTPVLTEADVFGAETEIPAPVQAVITAELREMAADVGMGAGDLSDFMQVARSVVEMPAEEVRVGWREQAVQRLNQEFGQGAQQALRDAAALAQRDPRVAAYLSQRAIGDHPDVVLQFARLAHQGRVRGTFK